MRALNILGYAVAVVLSLLVDVVLFFAAPGLFYAFLALGVAFWLFIGIVFAVRTGVRLAYQEIDQK